MSYFSPVLSCSHLPGCCIGCSLSLGFEYNTDHSNGSCCASCRCLYRYLRCRLGIYDMFRTCLSVCGSYTNIFRYMGLEEERCQADNYLALCIIIDLRLFLEFVFVCCSAMSNSLRVGCCIKAASKARKSPSCPCKVRSCSVKEWSLGRWQTILVRSLTNSNVSPMVTC